MLPLCTVCQAERSRPRGTHSPAVPAESPIAEMSACRRSCLRLNFQIAIAHAASVTSEIKTLPSPLEPVLAA